MGETVLITGGSGFLAQHLIKELQISHADRIDEIRVADKKLFKKFLDYPDNFPVREWIVDVVEEEELEDAMKGVTTVFHLAARKYSFDMYDDKMRQWEDSVMATKTVIQLMLKHGIEWLVFAGDALSVQPATIDAQAPLELGTLEAPKHNILGHYGASKFKAEEIVRRCNEKPFEEEAGKVGSLKTVVVRPTPLYGEGENWIVPYSLELAKEYGGKIYSVGNNKSIIQMTYAGNCAAMLTSVWKSLQERSDEFGGEVFFCSEGGRCQNYFDYIEPFLNAAGYKVVRSPYIPYVVGMCVFWILNTIFVFLSKLDLYFNHNLPNCTIVRMASGLNFHFSTSKARLMMDWEAPYEPEASMKKTIDWWKQNYRQVFS